MRGREGNEGKERWKTKTVRKDVCVRACVCVRVCVAVSLYREHIIQRKDTPLSTEGKALRKRTLLRGDEEKGERNIAWWTRRVTMTTLK